MLIIIHSFPSEFLFFFPLKQGFRGWCWLNSPVYWQDKHVEGFLPSSGVSNGTSGQSLCCQLVCVNDRKRVLWGKPLTPCCVAACRQQPTRCAAGSPGSPHWLQSVHLRPVTCVPALLLSPSRPTLQTEASVASPCWNGKGWMERWTQGIHVFATLKLVRSWDHVETRHGPTPRGGGRVSAVKGACWVPALRRAAWWSHYAGKPSQYSAVSL